MIEVVLHTARPLGEMMQGAAGPFMRLNRLGLVVSEHIDKIGFLQPEVEVVEKEILPETVRFTLREKEPLKKPLEEILRGFRIGVFRIALGYRLITKDDPVPIFKEMP